MKKTIRLYDTTLRDGAQTVGVTFSMEDKLRITAALDDLGIHYVEGGWPGSNPKDITFFSEVKKMRLKHARLAAFSSTKQKKIPIENDDNLRQLIASGAPVATVFGKAWDLHVRKALEVTLEENLEMIFLTIRHLRNHFEEIIFDAEHYFDGYFANPKYALKTLQTAADAGCDWIVLCDTNGGTMTERLRQAVRQAVEHVRVPLGIHTPNDAELAVANSMAAVESGVTQVQGTINGLGERCGNANLCSLIPNLALKMNIPCLEVEKIKKLTAVSRLVSELSNRPHPANLPYTGDNAFAHKGGIHVSAIRKDKRTYEHLPPECVGNQRVVSVSELSGKSNILEKARELGIKPDAKSPMIQTVLKKVKEMEAQGYHFEGADASFELLFKSLLDQVKTYFNLQGYRVLTWKNAQGRSFSEATIKADVPVEISEKNGISETLEHTSADGHGPVEALDRALRKVLEKFYPQLKEVKLVDYKVRILNEDQGTRATTRVLIHSADRQRRWVTVGVSDNIIDASWQALVDSLIFKLMKDEEQSRDKIRGKSRKTSRNKEKKNEYTYQSV